MIQSNAQDLEEIIDPESREFAQFDNKLRPQSFDEYVGQCIVKDNLEIAISATKKRGEPLDHVLLHGPAGLGKTTLAQIIAKEMSVNIKVTSGPALEKQGDVASIISNLNDNDVLFIDEIHRLKPSVEEILYSAMEDFGIDIIIGKGPSARSMRLNLPRFTLIGATTKISMMSSPLRDRFGSSFRLQFYTEDNIKQIILRSAKILDTKITDEAAKILAGSSRQTPRIANRLLKRARDFADIKNKSVIDGNMLSLALGALQIDGLGLDHTDRVILFTIISQ
ncbi:MAG: Holliday junction branch migration DNA helicase RuvB, partial [Candidatus Gracilibacteria bacterium]